MCPISLEAFVDPVVAADGKLTECVPLFLRSLACMCIWVISLQIVLVGVQLSSILARYGRRYVRAWRNRKVHVSPIPYNVTYFDGCRLWLVTLCVTRPRCRWLQRHGTSPATNLVLGQRQLYSNITLRSLLGSLAEIFAKAPAGSPCASR